MDDPALIDWTSGESYVLLNPRMPREEEARLRSLVIDLQAHVWLATSGTTGALKLAALSKNALLASAAAVNRHLASDAGDVWCCVLPGFHVGGLGIFVDIYFDNFSLVAYFILKLFQHRSHGFTRSTPGSIEVYQYRSFRVDYFSKAHCYIF